MASQPIAKEAYPPRSRPVATSGDRTTQAQGSAPPPDTPAVVSPSAAEECIQPTQGAV